MANEWLGRHERRVVDAIEKLARASVADAGKERHSESDKLSQGGVAQMCRAVHEGLRLTFDYWASDAVESG